MKTNEFRRYFKLGTPDIESSTIADSDDGEELLTLGTIIKDAHEKIHCIYPTNKLLWKILTVSTGEGYVIIESSKSFTVNLITGAVTVSVSVIPLKDINFPIQDIHTQKSCKECHRGMLCVGRLVGHDKTGISWNDNSSKRYMHWNSNEYTNWWNSSPIWDSTKHYSFGEWIIDIDKAQISDKTIWELSEDMDSERIKAWNIIDKSDKKTLFEMAGIKNSETYTEEMLHLTNSELEEISHIAKLIHDKEN